MAIVRDVVIGGGGSTPQTPQKTVPKATKVVNVIAPSWYKKQQESRSANIRDFTPRPPIRPANVYQNRYGDLGQPNYQGLNALERSVLFGPANVYQNRYGNLGPAVPRNIQVNPPNVYQNRYGDMSGYNRRNIDLMVGAGNAAGKGNSAYQARYGTLGKPNKVVQMISPYDIKAQAAARGVDVTQKWTNKQWGDASKQLQAARGVGMTEAGKQGYSTRLTSEAEDWLDFLSKQESARDRNVPATNNESVIYNYIYPDDWGWGGGGGGGGGWDDYGSYTNALKAWYNGLMNWRI